MDVIDELITHCEAWEPWARVMGNVCAGDAAQALRSLRAELAEARKPDCLLCKNYYEREDENDHSLYRGCALRLRLTPSDCINGSDFISVGPVRLYEKEGKV